MESGDTAPDFKLQNQDGEVVRLSDLRGRNVVLYERANAVVLGVSPDTPAKLRKFNERVLAELAA